MPAHLYGTRAAIFFLMHPSRNTGDAISKAKKDKLTPNAKVSSDPVNKVSLHPAESHVKPNDRIPVTHVTTDEFHFDFARLT